MVSSFFSLSARSFARNDASPGSPNKTRETLLSGLVLSEFQLEMDSTVAIVAQSASVAGRILKSSEIGRVAAMVRRVWVGRKGQLRSQAAFGNLREIFEACD